MAVRALRLEPYGTLRVDAELSGPFSGWSTFGAGTTSHIQFDDGRYVRIGGAVVTVPGEYVAVSYLCGWAVETLAAPTGNRLDVKYRGDRDPAVVPGSPPFYVRFLINETPLDSISVPSVAAASFVDAEVSAAASSLPTLANMESDTVRLQLLATDLSAFDPTSLAEFDIDVVTGWRQLSETAPKVRQRQRDDFRQRQRESRQLAPRGRSYI